MEKTIIETAKQRVLNHLLDHSGEEFYGSEIVAATKLSEGSVYQSLAALVAEGCITKKNKGRMIFYTANLDNPVSRQIKVTLNISRIKPLIDKLSQNSQKIILFGSVSTGTNSKESDWDILIVTENPEIVRKIIRKNVDLRLQPIILSAAAYLGLKQRDMIFFEEINRGIVVYERK